MRKIEEFKVVISKELGEFAVDIDFPDGTILQGHGKNITKIYEGISNLLCERLENDVNVLDGEQDG